MKYKIVQDSNPIMRKKSLEVEMPLKDEDREILNEMSRYLINSQDEEYLKKHKSVRSGVGLAAIQIGILKRMFVVYYNKGDEIIHYQLVNPKIIETSIKKCALKDGEGCLSVKEEHNGLSHRYYKIIIKAFDALQNKEVHIVAKGYDAVVLQHEYDHLDGIFFYDRIDQNNKFKALDNEILI